MKARHEAEVKAKAALDAEQDETSLTDRLDILKKSIALQQKSLDTTRKLADNANETHKTLADLLQVQDRCGDCTPEQLEPSCQEDERGPERVPQVFAPRSAIASDELDRLQSQRASLLASRWKPRRRPRLRSTSRRRP